MAQLEANDSIECKTSICFISPLKWICILQIGNQFPLKLAQCFLIFVNCFLDCSSSTAGVAVYSERLGGISSASESQCSDAGSRERKIKISCCFELQNHPSDEWELRVVMGTEGTHAKQSDLNLTKDSISVIFRQKMCVSDGGGVLKQ